ncbi:MAG TPA: recombinase family protein [Alphaproteobacteria bacterium]|nr:recombinase family protein [Alphaproteobacteria bacterium]
MKVGYARVSTKDQNTDLQIDALKEAGCEKIFEEKASGAQRDRPQLTAALNFMRSGDTLVVWKLDRLARSIKQLVDTIDDLKERKIGFLTLKDNIDTNTPAGKLFFHIFGSLAEFEREVIRERTTAGLVAARAKGNFGGRERAMNDDDLEAARTLLQNDKLSTSQVAKRLGISVATLYRYFPGGRGELSEK